MHVKMMQPGILPWGVGSGPGSARRAGITEFAYMANHNGNNHLESLCRSDL